MLPLRHNDFCKGAFIGSGKCEWVLPQVIKNDNSSVASTLMGCALRAQLEREGTTSSHKVLGLRGNTFCAKPCKTMVKTFRLV